MKNLSDEIMFVLCYGVGKTIHYGELRPGMTVDTGQPFLDAYLTREALGAGIDTKFSVQTDRDRVRAIINASDKSRAATYATL